MADEDAVYRPQQARYCLIAVAFTFVIFGFLYSIEQGSAVVLFAASISLTGIPFWLIVKRQRHFHAGVASLWAIHAVVNLCGWLMAFISSEHASEGGLEFALFLGLVMILFHIGLLIRATIIVRQKRELVDRFALAALYLCPLLLAIGIIFFDT